MPFKLCNVLGTFQGYINKSLNKYFDRFFTAYLDNVLVYSILNKNHAKHVLKVLKCLKKQGLQVEINKCKFSTIRVKYLGLIVTTGGIKINLEKTNAVQNWEVSLSVKDVQAFLNFANFYCCFIINFSKNTKPLVKLTKGMLFTIWSRKKKVKCKAFKWIVVRHHAFEKLKHAFTTTLVLAHYDSTQET